MYMGNFKLNGIKIKVRTIPVGCITLRPKYLPFGVHEMLLYM